MFGTCILLVCGLPASGKSSLMADLLSYFKFLSSQGQNEHASPVPAVFFVSYDELVPLDIQRDAIKKQDEWRSLRRDILSASERILRKTLNLEVAADSPPENKFYEKLLSANRLVLDEMGGRCPAKGLLVLVDDNLYYPSMRYSWHQLARKLSAGFCQAWLECPLPELRDRNAARPASVPPEVIEVMARRAEAPDPARNPWECHSLVLQTSNLNKAHAISALWDLAVKASADPVKPAPVPEHVEPLSPSDVNIVDQELRRIVSSKVQESRGKGVKIEPYAREMNLTRLRVLEKLRSGRVHIPPVVKDDKESLKEFVLCEFLLEQPTC